jgi:hypothetical protein
MDDALAALHDYYTLGERGRLTGGGRGVLEFERTKEILLRRLPMPPASDRRHRRRPGRYTLWLAGRWPKPGGWCGPAVRPAG